MKKLIVISLSILWLAGCGGSGGDNAAENVGDTPTLPPIPDVWADVTATLDAYEVEDLALIVGNASGDVFIYEKGSFNISGRYDIASASKWLTSATVLALVEQGVMRLDDQPQDYLEFWTADPADPRSAITLEQLLSFTAGFHRSPAQAGCIGDGTIELQACIAEWHNIGPDATPDTTFHYGPVHMQVAAAMAEVATGQRWTDVVRLTIAEPLALTNTGFSGINPRASGAADSTARDYASFLRAHLTGERLAGTVGELVSERTTGVRISAEPSAIADNGVDWQYGLGVWRECDEPAWNTSCEARTVVSSAGAFGWYPWLDLDLGYYAVLAMQEPATLFSSPGAASVQLGVNLQPMIIEALGD